MGTLTTDDGSPAVPAPAPAPAAAPAAASAAAPAAAAGPAPPTYPWHTAPPPVAPRVALPRRQGQRAGIVTRLVANTIDAIVVALVLGGLWLFAAALRYMLSPKTFSFPAPSGALILAIAAFVEFVYLTLAWTLAGRTYGDQVMGLRVLGPFGRLRFPGAVLRAAFCVVVPIGIFWVAVSRHNRSVQDVVLRTSVVYDWTTRSARDA